VNFKAFNGPLNCLNAYGHICTQGCIYPEQTNDSRRYTCPDTKVSICLPCAWVLLVVVFSLAAQTIDMPYIYIYRYIYNIYIWQTQTGTGVSWASHQNESQILARMGQWSSEYAFCI